jgi:cobalt-precorrin-5B (C1)-methyltransferase
MNDMPEGPLKRGWTSGACAAAGARAAFTALLDGEFPDPVTISLPGGQSPSFPLARHKFDGDTAEVSIVKDAGDDPDVTHGALVVVRARLDRAGRGVSFKGGEGVGTVTREGLVLEVGEPAINPGPRRMIEAEIEDVASVRGSSRDVEIEISIPGGEKLAQRTLNGRLGIVGGLSVLGTTGVVIPFSCSAWIHSIHRSIDVARAAGIQHAAASTGSTSERAVQSMFEMPEEALIDMGDFVGGTLKYLRLHPIPRLTIAGGFAKLSKLGAGLLDLHSKRSSVDLVWLIDEVAAAGSTGALIEQLSVAETAGQALQIAQKSEFPIADLVARKARETAMEHVASETTVDVMVFDRHGDLVGRSDA